MEEKSKYSHNIKVPEHIVRTIFDNELHPVKSFTSFIKFVELDGNRFELSKDDKIVIYNDALEIFHENGERHKIDGNPLVEVCRTYDGGIGFIVKKIVFNNKNCYTDCNCCIFKEYCKIYDDKMNKWLIDSGFYERCLKHYSGCPKGAEGVPGTYSIKEWLCRQDKNILKGTDDDFVCIPKKLYEILIDIL